MWLRLWEKLKKPSKALLIVTYTVTAVCIASALVLVIVGSEHPVLQVLSYVSYALAAITLAYTVYTLVGIIPKAVRAVKEKLRTHPWTRRMMQSYGFRTLIFSVGSCFMTVAYGLYYGGIALTRFMPVWHGALAGYYITLAFMRGGILFYHGDTHRKKRERKEAVEIRKYRSCGILLIVVIISLSAAILQMVQADAGFDKPGMMIYVAALYTVIKVTTAIRNFFKAKKQTDYTVEALRNVNLADAAVSVLALQTAMFHTFGGEGIATGVANAATGAAVCLVVLSLGIFMVVKGQRGFKKLREDENNDGVQSAERTGDGE